jgi:hypothetical protein
MRRFVATVALCIAAVPAWATAPKTITAFAAPSPGQPLSPLVTGSDGIIYGVEFGSLGIGGPGAPFPSVFSLTVQKGRLEAALIKVAPAGALTGALSTLVPGANGVLYGSATLNGCINLGSGFTFPCAAVVSLTPPAAGHTEWTPGLVYPLNAGGIQITALASGPDGTLLGATSGNVVFQLTPPASGQGAFTFQSLYTFTGGADGSFPAGRLLLQHGGSIFGSTYTGGVTLCGSNGTSGCGTVFRLDPPATGKSAYAEKTLYSGKAGPIQLSYQGAGALYGVGQAGSAGAVVRLTPGTSTGGSWIVTTLTSFAGGADGASPTYAGLVPLSHGRILGTTAGGGLAGCTPMPPATGCGDIFELTPTAAGFTKTTLWSFTGGTDGAGPYGGLLATPHLGLLGETYYGGAGKLGTLYRLSIPVK